MAKDKVSQWSSTPANNTDVGGIDISEGCAPSGINNALREIMAQVKDMQAGTDGDNLTVGGNLSVTGTASITGNTTISGSASITGKTTTDLVGDVYASNGTSKILESGTDGTNATFTGTSSKSTNIVGGNNTTQLGSLPYQSNTDTTTLLAPNTTTTKKYLSQTGNGTNGAAPVWDEVNLLTMGTAVSPTGTTTAAFTNIPSWVKRITVSFYRVSGTSSGAYYIQLGTGGTYATTGYSTYATNVSDSSTSLSGYSDGICVMGATDGSSFLSGIWTITKVSGNIWVGAGSGMRSGDSLSTYTQGSITLGGTLDSLRILRGTANYDSGTINIMYE